MIASVDEFIIYDDVQFTKNDWRNRNKIKTPQGVNWITVPVGKNISRKIREVEIPSSAWQVKHWKMLGSNYRKSPFFDDVESVLAPLYLDNTYTNLSDMNRTFIEAICKYLGISTAIKFSWDYNWIEGRNERLVDLCAQAGASQYVSGPAAKGYLDERLFTDKGIDVSWFDYGEYREYKQLWGDFAHQVSVLDLLFNCGPSSGQYMRNVVS